jgi:hypothetical protein
MTISPEIDSEKLGFSASRLARIGERVEHDLDAERYCGISIIVVEPTPSGLRDRAMSCLWLRRANIPRAAGYRPIRHRPGDA